MNESPANHPKSTLKEKILGEMKNAFSLSLYLGTWFCAIAFMAATALEERPIPLSIFGFALIKAALCAKFMLIAQAAYPIKVRKDRGIVTSLFLESLVYILVVIALNYLESGLHGLIDGKAFIPSMFEFGRADPLRILAMSIVYWLISWPYLIFMGINLELGNTATLSILFGSKK